MDGKSNEITAIPPLLELLDLHGALVTIDAMGCQKAIAATISCGRWQLFLTVKENQENLLTDIQESWIEADDIDFAGLKHDSYETRDCGHGREEYRCYRVLHSTAGIRNADAWAGLTTIGMCYRRRTIGDQISEETHYFIGSMEASAPVYGQALRHHWGIENNLHWQLDVTFGEDRAASRPGTERRTSICCWQRLRIEPFSRPGLSHPRRQAGRAEPAGSSPGAMARQDLCPLRPARLTPVLGRCTWEPLAAKMAQFLTAINNLLRKLALILLKRHPAKGSIACKRLHAALDVNFLEEVIQHSDNS